MLRNQIFLNKNVQNFRCLAQAAVEHSQREVDFSRDEYQFLHKSGLKTYFFQESLRKLPIPDVEKSVERFLNAVKGIGTEKQIKDATEAVKSLATLNGSKISELQTNLIVNDRTNKHTSYISEPWFDMYLSARVPVPINYNPFMMLTPDPRPEFNDQLVRATYMAISCARFKKALDAQVLSPEIFHVKPKYSDTAFFQNFVKMFPKNLAWFGAVAFQAFPLDMSQYPSLFGGNRIPHRNKDKLHRAEKPRHVLVVRKGTFYTVDLFDELFNIKSPREIHAAFAKILATGEAAKSEECVGSLTTLDRDIWADTRDDIHSSSAKNAESLKKVDDALFILCLDDDKTTDHAQLANNLLCGQDGRNRWFDKCFQLIVDGNGNTTINFEHSWGDGVAVLRLVEEIYKDTSSMNWIKPGDEPQGEGVISKLDWNLSDKAKSTIKQAQEQFLKEAANVQFGTVEYDRLTRNQIKKLGISPDSVMQLAIQIAYHNVHKTFTPTYESSSTAAFKKGRTECVRSATVATRTVVEELEKNGTKDKAKLTQLMKEASNIHGNLVKEAAMGHGFDRHLLGLKITGQRYQLPLPDFFNSSIYNYMNQFQISTSTLSTESIVFGGFGPVVRNGYGIGYNVGKTRLGAVVSTFKDQRDAPKFCGALEESLDLVREVIVNQPKA